MAIEKAISHIVNEVMLDNIKVSLEEMYDNIQKSHDAIHMFLLIAPEMFPTPSPHRKYETWQTRSAFLTYHQEIFNSAHRSLIEALCSFYNTAFVLLRSTLELILKGTLFECLAHREFRNNSKVLEKDEQGARLINLLNKVMRDKPDVEDELEKVSGTIHDIVMVVIENQKYRPSILTLVKQLSQWKLLEPIEYWRKEVVELYKKLSADVHVVPDRTDVGRVLLTKPENLFKAKKVMPNVLAEYLDCLKRIMDIGIVIELNVLKDNVKIYKEVESNLREMLSDLRELELEYSFRRIRSLLG